MADWTEILKKPLISIPKQKIRIKKPKKIEQEDDCKRKLKEIAKRMHNTPLFDMKFKINGANWVSEMSTKAKQMLYRVATWLPENDEDIRALDGNTVGAIGYVAGEPYDDKINELSEKVCCEALKHLKAVSNGNVLSEQTIDGLHVGSHVIKKALRGRGEHPVIHVWNREVYIKNLQGSPPNPLLSKVTIGIYLKFYLEEDIPSEALWDSWSDEIDRAFKECERMFKEAVG